MTSRLMAVLVAVAACSPPAPVPVARPAQAPPPQPVVISVPNPGATATAIIRDGVGTLVGNAMFTESYAGVLVSGTVFGIGLGVHGIHIHSVGKCEPPFTTAGGHFNPTGRKHGFMSSTGAHLGDMPNIETPAAGQMHFEFLLPGVVLIGRNGLIDDDGASIVIHATKDDYTSDPAGNSGARIACGVITR